MHQKWSIDRGPLSWYNIHQVAKDSDGLNLENVAKVPAINVGFYSINFGWTQRLYYGNTRSGAQLVDPHITTYKKKGLLMPLTREKKESVVASVTDLLST